MRSLRELSTKNYAARGADWSGLKLLIFPPTLDIGVDTRPSTAIIPAPSTAWTEFFTFVAIWATFRKGAVTRFTVRFFTFSQV